MNLAECTSTLTQKGGADSGLGATLKVDSGTDGVVTNATVRNMHACLMARGWHKVAN